MEHDCLNSKRFIFHFLRGFHLLWLIAAAIGGDSDKLALLDFKDRVTGDPFQIMSSWNDSIHFCNWVGVTCTPPSIINERRVMILNLDSQQLVGFIPPSIGNLTSLTEIHLQRNGFHGELPQQIGHLQRLQHLNLSYNEFGGKIPMNLSHCTELSILDANYNQFTGKIPDQLSSLSKLIILRIGANNLTGNIPAWIGNFSSLNVLTLARNNFHGNIPYELGLLSSLGFFQLYANYLSGTVPPSIYNISSIYLFSVTQNQLNGQLPSDVGLTLPNLRAFYCALNSFTGSIPVSLSNASKLQIVEFGSNYFTGKIPENLGILKDLVDLNLHSNRLGNGEVGDLNFLTSLANCTSLESLDLSDNRLGGVLPSSIANLSTQLHSLTLGGNQIHGNIHPGIGNLVNLTLLGLDINNLTGIVPDSIGKLHKLEGLFLRDNKFYGSIPSSIGNMTTLTKLDISENEFEGIIPPSLGNCDKLLMLNLSRNNLNGTIPKQVIGLSSLSISLDMSRNLLTGSLPFEVGNLKNLVELDLSENKLSGEIPSSLEGCVGLQNLYLERNTFEGPIPQSLNSLASLEELDLSHNNFSRQIPEFLNKLSYLRHLNLSYNQLEGEVSREGIFANASAVSLIGNDKLCGGVPELHLPVCSTKNSSKHLNPKVQKFMQNIYMYVTLGIIFAILLLCSFVIYRIAKHSRRHSTATSSNEWRLGLSYTEISKSTDNFSGENFVGSGSFGSVYKGIISSDGTIVAIKVLKLQEQGALKSFTDECNALRSIRHRNIVKVITACSSVDHEGNDFKALVFEFMSNGNLDQWLHPPNADKQNQIKKLSLTQRLNILVDVASALDYLHHHCETPIAHCDLKPSNVLIDGDMVAHVGDFGLARLLFEDQTISVALKGSIGYIPPEYNGGHVCILGDIYSYGILLLEMFTRKRPTDDMFRDDLSIHKFVEMALSHNVMDIVDRSMLIEEENVDENNGKEESTMNNDLQINIPSELVECLASVMRIGLICSTTSPRERMAMNDVVKNLQTIRDSFLKFKHKNKRRKR